MQCQEQSNTRLFPPITVHLTNWPAAICPQNKLHSRINNMSARLLNNNDLWTTDSQTKAADQNKKPSGLHLCRFEQVPSYLQTNPYLRSGYRAYLTKKDCVTSVFTWTNETVNIWSHLLGLGFFAGLLFYDLFVIIPSFRPTFGEALVMILFVLSCINCLACSAAYHTFCCHSEETYLNFLKWDIAGIVSVFATIFISGIHYAYSCFSTWRVFYQTIVSVLTFLVLKSQLQAKKNPLRPYDKKTFSRDDKKNMVVFTLWAIFGFVPTFHWTYLEGGLQSPFIQSLLPRVGVMYLFIGVAFFFYISRFPERCCPGKVDYVGASHQIWHILVVATMFWWHQAGIRYAEVKAIYGCINGES